MQSCQQCEEGDIQTSVSEDACMEREEVVIPFSVPNTYLADNQMQCCCYRNTRNIEEGS